MRAIVWALGFLVAGYLVGAGLAFALVDLLSASDHARQPEALSAAIFYVGPVAAVLAAILGLILGLRRPHS